MADTPAPTASPPAEKTYTPSETARMLKMVDSGHFAQHPFGEFVASLAAQLRLADAQISGGGLRALHAEMKLERLQKEFRETEMLLLRLRDENQALKAKLPQDAADDCL